MTQDTDRRRTVASPEAAQAFALLDGRTIAPVRPLRFGVPRVSPHLLHRERLFARLCADEEAPLTVVQAGSGFGKTSLLADWARRRSPVLPTVWVTADASVRDALAFWREALHGLARAGLLTGTGLEDLDVRGDIADTLMSSLRRGLASIDLPVTLVIDGFERLAGTALERDLIELLTRTDNLHLVVATHVASELTSVTTAARLDTVTIDASALRFSGEEVRRLADRLGVDASAGELEELREELDGWPFGIRAVLESRRREESATLGEAQHALFGVPSGARRRLDTGSAHRHLLASLDGIAGLESLAPTAVLDSFTMEQAAAMGAELDGHPILTELESRGLGTWHPDADPDEYRLHPVLRRALRERLDREPESTRTAYERLAGWHVDRGDFAQAFEAAIRAGDWSLATRCVRSDLFEILVRLRLHPDLLDVVPRPVLRREPLLMLVHGIARYGSGNQARGVRTLLAAVAACEKQRVVTRGAPSPDQVWVQGVLTIALRLAGRYETVPAAVRRFSRMLDAVDDPNGHLDAAMPLFRTQTVITLGFIDRLTEAEQVALSTLHEHHRMSPLQQANLHGLIALTHARRGDLRRASAALETLQELGKPQQFDESFFAVSSHIAAAWVALENFDPDAAAERLGLSDRHWPTMEYWPFVLEARTHIAWQRHGAHAALLLLREGRAEKRSKVPIGDAMGMLLTALEAELLMAAGLGAEASALMTPNRLRRSPRMTIPKSRSLLLGGNWDQAAGLADRNALSEAQPWTGSVDLLLISASANLRAGDRDAAQQRFDQAASLAARMSIRTPFAAMPREDLLALGDAHRELTEQISSRPARYAEPGIAILLSKREQLALAELASDRTLAEIAQRLSVSPNTLKSQLRSVYRKLGVGGRQEAVQAARRSGLLFMSGDERSGRDSGR
ncbi:LuxR C-terminal-related transcriptional regulator [Microbacterium sp.]|uniref:LuxR C-terminal-related transcriptional regulator n=1 Tax=Microbacterium sp. TaxID=51671 RepID=UPI00281172F4|nr:LuxR C-terminal-related transcriptional regulator [Microbacterium sp.]